MIAKRRMEWSRSIMPAALAALLGVMSLAPAAYSQQRRRPAPLKTVSVYGQGYQKGYADGFAQGNLDWTRGVPRDWQRSDAYERRENSYSPRLSSSQEYTQGYQLGFEMGHTDGYYGRTRNAAVPANALVLAKAAALADAQRSREQESNRDNPRDGRDGRDGERSRRVTPVASLDVPEDTELRIQLTTPIDTKTNRVGDTFTAKVIMPSAYEGSIVDGHIANVNRSGRVSGKTELALDFDTITLPDGRQIPLKADLVRVIESENVKKVDEEGQVESGSRTKDSTVRGGVGATAGAIIGGIAGGAKGAILGAIIGGAAGVGTVYVEGNKDLILDRGTEMVIRTAGRSRR